MTVNHDVVGSSPTGGVVKRSKERFFYFLGFIYQDISEYFFIYFYFFSLFYVCSAQNFYFIEIFIYLFSLSDKLVLSIRKVFYMLQKYYDRSLVFLKQIENEYSILFQSTDEWELLHLKFLLYYLIRFKIKNEKDFLLCHFRAAYRIYLNYLLGQNLNYSF